jgi:coenzyme F420-dependent glucose-6-phosphate dehydrogenase
LNEHIVGEGWPEVEVRQEQLAEAIQVIRLLWEGGQKSHHGNYFVVENARVYDLPDKVPHIMVAAAGPKSVEIAVRFGDGLIGTEPDREMLQPFKNKAGSDKPCYGELTVCFDRDEERATRLAREIWPIAGLPSPLLQELPLPSHVTSTFVFIRLDRIKKHSWISMDGRYFQKLTASPKVSAGRE